MYTDFLEGVATLETPRGQGQGKKLPTRRKDKEKTDQCQDESLKENSEGQQARTREIGTTQTT